MSDEVEAARDLVDRRYKTAMLFSLPLIAGFGMLFLLGVWGIGFLEPGEILLWIVIGLFIGAVPATRYGRAKKAYDRARMREKLDQLAAALETP